MTCLQQLILGILLAISVPLNAAGRAARPWGDWPQWGDQGDGTYRNPVLPSDYSDIDCICVGADYYAISSTFQFSPGMVILHSLDLVNWTIAGHAVTDLTQISPELNWERMNRYYHFFSEVRAEGRVIVMQRSTNIFGPYQEKQQLKHADREANEPNQGGSGAGGLLRPATEPACRGEASPAGIINPPATRFQTRRPFAVCPEWCGVKGDFVSKSQRSEGPKAELPDASNRRERGNKGTFDL